MRAPSSTRAPTARFGQRRGRGPRPSRHDPRRRRFRHRAVAALLFGRRRIGARLRLSAARPQGPGRRPDRRPGPCRVRARSAHPAEQFGGNFGIVPFFDGGSLSTEAMPDFKHWRFAAGIGVRYYSCFGPIRDRLRRPAQPPERRRAVRGHRLARPGLLMAETRSPNAPAPSRRAPRSGRDWRWRLLNELFALFIALLFLLAGAARAARQRAGPSLHRRPDRQDRDRVGPANPHRPNRRLDLRQVAAAERQRRRPARGVPDLAQHQARLDARRLARRTSSTSTA